MNNKTDHKAKLFILEHGVKPPRKKGHLSKDSQKINDLLKSIKEGESFVIYRKNEAGVRNLIRTVWGKNQKNCFKVTHAPDIGDEYKRVFCLVTPQSLKKVKK